MRELILKMSVSIDGFVADREGGTAWMFTGDPEAKAWSVRTVANASLHIMGSTTFRAMAAYWPTSTDVFAPAMNEIPKAVFSRSDSANRGPLGGAASWAEAYVASGDLADEVANLKAIDGKPILVHGGASFARSVVAHDLVDVYALLVIPIVLGAGLPIFANVATPRQLKLIGSERFPSGATAQTYRRG